MWPRLLKEWVERSTSDGTFESKHESPPSALILQEQEPEGSLILILQEFQERAPEESLVPATQELQACVDLQEQGGAEPLVSQTVVDEPKVVGKSKPVASEVTVALHGVQLELHGELVINFTFQDQKMRLSLPLENLDFDVQ